MVKEPRSSYMDASELIDSTAKILKFSERGLSEIPTSAGVS